ncbi:putative phosphatidate phosphatase [Culicoides brevitarsis]|uniref:putative phosphatidate phosphatase n=1 Tax=Culicoides brevitarsis TaxID=469753 RepID=UPI00307B2B1A
MINKDTLRLVYRISRDLILVACAAAVYIGFKVAFNVFEFRNRTGFYCSDPDLWYPYKASSVPTKVLLWYICTLIPIGVFLVIEAKWSSGGIVRFFNFNFPIWIPATYNRMVQYVLGFYLQMSFMLLPKFFDAPHFLRPHFMAVCQPLIGPQNVSCAEITNPHQFITDYECRTDAGFTISQIQNVYFTFPSGHTSCSFYTAVYLVVYLQNRVRAKSFRELKLILQFLLLIMATSVGITRLQDHHHHGVDVIFGAILGSGIAIFANLSLQKLFPTVRDVTGFTNHGSDDQNHNNFEGIDIQRQQNPQQQQRSK